jgi:hypothetical protein
MHFPAPTLSAIDAAAEVVLETRMADGPPHRTIVWIAVDGQDAYVRSVLGERGRWYREAIEQGSLVLHVGDAAIPTLAVRVDDPGEATRATAALAAKYAGDPDLPPLLRPEVLPMTLRLEPA